jgi:hypothetical protein
MYREFLDGLGDLGLQRLNRSAGIVLTDEEEPVSSYSIGDRDIDLYEVHQPALTDYLLP